MKNCEGRISNWLKYQRNRLKRSGKYLCTYQVLQYLRDEDVILTEEERTSFINYLKHHLAGGLNLSMNSEYKYRHVEVIYDSDNGMHYVVTEEGHRLYFKKGLTKPRVRRMYNNLCAELDKESPHNYCFDNVVINSDTILADVGAAEGNFSLKFIDKVKKNYLFEADEEWIEALKATFEPWKEKIVIVNKYVSNEDGENLVSLDNYFIRNEKPTLLKLDVEGAERSVLQGAEQLLKSGNVSDLLVCLYHRKEDAEVLPDMLRQKNYRVNFAPGHILMMPESGFVPDAPFDFRKGLCHALLQPSSE